MTCCCGSEPSKGLGNELNSAASLAIAKSQATQASTAREIRQTNVNHYLVGIGSRLSPRHWRSRHAKLHGVWNHRPSMLAHGGKHAEDACVARLMLLMSNVDAVRHCEVNHEGRHLFASATRQLLD